jgi:rod shape-determining protein MreC
MSKKNIFLFVLVLGASFILMTHQSRKGLLFAGDFIAYALNRSHAFTKSVTDSISSPFRKISLRDEDNKMLRKQIDEFLLERTRYQEAVLENMRLNALLQLRESRNDHITAARVLSRGTERWAHVFVLGKGKSDGVSNDMSAITPNGLAGKIFDVSGSYSKLLLLTDINFSAAVRLQESRKEGIVSGTGSGKAVLKYIPEEEDVNIGDTVSTSGLDRLFPPGIPVGVVSKVDKEAGGHFQYIEIIPYVNNSQIEEVLIIQ